MCALSGIKGYKLWLKSTESKDRVYWVSVYLYENMKAFYIYKREEIVLYRNKCKDVKHRNRLYLALILKRVS